MKPVKPKFIITSKRILIASAVAFAALLSGCGNGSHPAPEACEITAPVDSLVQSVFTDDNAPGAIIMIVRDGDIKYSRCVGRANLQTGEPLTENTLINVSSVSKTFVVAGIMKLVDQGLIDLEAPLSTYFPEFNKEVFDKINLTHVFTHSTGLPDLRPRNTEQWHKYIARHPEIPFLNNEDYIHFGKESEFISFYMDVDTLISEPGSKFFYQDPPFMLISTIIERVTGEEFEKWMKDNIFEPVGIASAQYNHSHTYGNGIAHAYKPKSRNTPPQIFVSKDSLWEEFDYGEAPFFRSRCDKGLFITPLDHIKWLEALYGGAVINEEHLATATYRSKEAHFRDTGYCFGAYITGGNGEKPLKIYHNNGNGGYTVFESVFPDDKLIYFIFSNYAGWNRLEMSKKLDKILEDHEWIKAKR